MHSRPNLTRSRVTRRANSFRPGLEALEDRTVPSTVSVSVFATGLDNPRGLAFGPNGHLYVAEAGVGGPLSTVGSHDQVPAPLGPFTGGYTGRISRINPAGNRHTLVDHLPSAQTTPETGSEVLGPAAIEFVGKDMYVLIEAGAANGLEGTFNGVFRVRPNGSLVTLANLSQHNQDVFDGIPDDDHSPEGNPYSMTRLGGTLYVTEANYGAVTRVNLDGTVTRLVDVAAQVGHITPTGIAAGPDGNLYVGVIGEFPYLDGGAKIFQVTPAGTMSVFADNMTAIVDLEFDKDGRLYALETFSGNTPAPPFFNPSSGRIRRLGDGGWETLISGLTNPTAMTFGPDDHLYVSHKGHGLGTAAGQGEILEIEWSEEAGSCHSWGSEEGRGRDRPRDGNGSDNQNGDRRAGRRRHGHGHALRPFLGRGSGRFTDAAGGFFATGIATHLGRFTHYGTLILTPTDDPAVVKISGRTTYEAANGDKLYANLDGTLNMATGVGSGTDTWDGGTGRFTHASGRAHVTVQLSPDGTFAFNLFGVIRY